MTRICFHLELPVLVPFPRNFISKLLIDVKIQNIIAFTDLWEAVNASDIGSDQSDTRFLGKPALAVSFTLVI